MNKEEAKAEAVKRWGKLAMIRHDTKVNNLAFRFMVGKKPATFYYGASWEAAFAYADNREGRRLCKFCNTQFIKKQVDDVYCSQECQQSDVQAGLD